MSSAENPLAFSKELADAKTMVTDFNDFLDGLQRQWPSQPRAPFLSETDRTHVQGVQREIDKLRVELQGINHERVVVDVLTRPAVSEIKQLVDRSLVRHNTEQRKALLFANTSSINNNRRTNDKEKDKDKEKIVDLDEPIRIPDYIPPHLRTQTRSQTRTRTSSVYTTQPTHTTRGVPLVTARTVDKSATIVPNMRVGELPPDLRQLNLKLQQAPFFANPSANAMPKVTRRRKKTVSVTSSTTVDLSPLKRDLQLRFSEQEEEMKRLRLQLTKTDNKLNREKMRANKRLQAIADMIEEKQLWKDQALLSSIDELIQEAISGFHDIVDEVDLIAMLEDVIREIPKPEDLCIITPPSAYIPPPQFTVPAPPVVVSEPEPEPVPAPPPPQREELAVQTEPVEEEEKKEEPPIECERNEKDTQTESDAPVAPAVPPVPQIIQPQVVFQREGVEGELVKLMQSLVQNYQHTVQGQQTLVLQLLAEREREREREQIVLEEVQQGEERPQEEEEKEEEPLVPVEEEKAVCREEKEIQTEELVVEAPQVITDEEHTIVQQEEEESAPIPAPTEKASPTREYNTALGAVVLGGQGLLGPYSVLPRGGHLTHVDNAHESEEETESEKERRWSSVGVHRRASPLIARLLQPTAEEWAAMRGHTLPQPLPAHAHNTASTAVEEEKKSETEAGTVSPSNLIEFATKLLETVRPTEKETAKEPINKADLAKMINEGVARGIQQALGVLAPSERERERDAEREMEREMRRVKLNTDILAGRDVRYTEDAYADSLLLKKAKTHAKEHLPVYERDSFDMDAITAEAEKSEKLRRELLKEDEDVWSYADSISLDSDFQALYGRDSFERTHRLTGHKVRESVDSAEKSESSLSGIESVVSGRERRETARVLARDSVSDSVSVSISVDYSAVRDSVDSVSVTQTHALPPLCSHVLPQQATTRVRTQMLKESNRRRAERDFDDKSSPLLRDSLSTTNSLSSSCTSSFVSTSITSSTSSASSLRRTRRYTEDRDRRKALLASLNSSIGASPLREKETRRRERSYDESVSSSSSQSLSSSFAASLLRGDSSDDDYDAAERKKRSSRLRESMDFSVNSADSDSDPRTHIGIPLLAVRRKL